jgi:hypothetical protein
MKNLRIVLIALALVLAGWVPTQAQLMSIGGGAGFLLPTNTMATGSFEGPGRVYSTPASSGFGAHLNFRIAANPHLPVGINTGVYRLELKGANNGFALFVPIMGVFEYYFLTEKIRPFVGGEAGVAFTHVFIQSQNPLFADWRSSRWVYGLGPTAGCRFDISEKVDFGVDARYQIYVNAWTDHAAFDIATANRPVANNWTALSLNFSIIYKFSL